jgi:UPF0755 protein
MTSQHFAVLLGLVLRAEDGSHARRNLQLAGFQRGVRAFQIDATVQYAKANDKNVSRWWPSVLPRDIYRRSPYNTYQHPGLPPTPIASPSVAAILAALNPIKTSCLFYFNDKAGAILCSDTYDEHVARLKQEYGRGK